MNQFRGKHFKSFLLLSALVILNSLLQAKGDDKNRWRINPSGSISWFVDDRLPHADHIEMSGDSISAILHYKVNADQSFQLQRQLVWPMLRTIPNNTHASLIRYLSEDLMAKINVNGRQLSGEKVDEISLIIVSKIK